MVLSQYQTATTRSSLILIVTSTVLVGSATLYWLQRKRRPNGIEEDDDDDGNYNNNNNRDNNNFKMIDLPSHVKREIHKEKRRQISIRWMAMKKPMYDNIEMYGPSTETGMSSSGSSPPQSHPSLLCTISEKKAKWYVKKKLAKWIMEDEDKNVDETEKNKNGGCPSRKIQLLFKPKGGDRPGSRRSSGSSSSNGDSSKVNKNVDQSISAGKSSNDTNRNATADAVSIPKNHIKAYNTSHKHNICVVCGDDQYFMRHYIIPYCYRTLLPQKYKSHMPHDIVILCPDCHVICDQQTQLKQKYLEGKLRNQVEKELKNKIGNVKYMDTSKSVILNRETYHVKSCATALLKFKHKLPPARIADYETTIRDYYYNNNARQERVREQEQSSSTNANGESTEHRKQEETGELLELSNELLQETSKLETTLSNPYYIPGPTLVVESFLQQGELAKDSTNYNADAAISNDDSNTCNHDRRKFDDTKIEQFIRNWRMHFLEIMTPRYLPKGWSIDNPVHCD